MWGHHVKERFPAERVCSRYRLLRARDSKASKIQPGVLDEKYYKIIKKSVLMLKMRWYLAMDLTQQTGQGLTAHQKKCAHK